RGEETVSGRLESAETISSNRPPATIIVAQPSWVWGLQASRLQRTWPCHGRFCRLRNCDRFVQRKIPLDFAENTFAVQRTILDDAPAALAVAQKMLLLIPRRTQQDQWLHTYQATWEHRFRRQREATQTRISSPRPRLIAVRALPIPAPRRLRRF